MTTDAQTAKQREYARLAQQYEDAANSPSATVDFLLQSDDVRKIATGLRWAAQTLAPPPSIEGIGVETTEQIARSIVTAHTRADIGGLYAMHEGTLIDAIASALRQRDAGVLADEREQLREILMVDDDETLVEVAQEVMRNRDEQSQMDIVMADERQREIVAWHRRQATWHDNYAAELRDKDMDLARSHKSIAHSHASAADAIERGEFRPKGEKAP